MPSCLDDMLSAPNEVFIALDVGTTNVKAGLYSRDGSCLIRGATLARFSSPNVGYIGMDLERTWRSIVDAVRSVTSRMGARTRVAGIGLSVCSPTVVAVDLNGRAISRGLTYADASAASRLDAVRRSVGDEQYRQLTGNRLAPSLCSAATMLHLLDGAGAGQSTGLRVGHLNSFVVNRLTGRWVMDWTNASYTGLVNLRSPHEWSEAACRALGFPAGLLPELVAPWEPVGHLSPKGAADLGLDGSVVVVAGAADTACAAYGVNAVADGQIFESIGTSGVLTVCSSHPPDNPLFMNRSHVLPGRWLSHGAMSSAGAAVRWLAEGVFAELVPSSDADNGSQLAWINAEADRSEPGAGGVVFLPYLMGERTPVWDPDARGAWVGLSTETKKHDLIRAVLESTGYAMKQMIEIAEAHTPARTTEVLTVGGGSRSDLWTSLRADIMGKPYKRLRESEAASRGAALLAAVGNGTYTDVWEASDVAVPPATEATIHPTDDLPSRRAYDANYEIYSGLYSGLRGVFCA